MAPESVYLKNERGRVWGPVSAEQAGLLVENGLVDGPVQVSLDGVRFQSPARHETVGPLIPRASWSEPVETGSVPLAGPGARAHMAAKLEEATPDGEGAGPVEGLPVEGELSERSPIHLYYRAAAAQASVLLTLELTDRTLGIHFKKGEPQLVGSSHPNEGLGAFLQAQKLLSAEEVARAQSEKQRFGGELIGALFGLALLNPAEAFNHLALRARVLLTRAMLADKGRFRLEPSTLPPQRALPLGNRWTLLVDVLRRASVPDLKRRLTPVADLPIMKSGGRIGVTELRLTPQETRALSRFDGVRSLRSLVADHPQEAEPIARLTLLLSELELVTFSSQPERRGPEASIDASTDALDDANEAEVAGAEPSGASAASPGASGAATPSAPQGSPAPTVAPTSKATAAPGPPVPASNLEPGSATDAAPGGVTSTSAPTAPDAAKRAPPTNEAGASPRPAPAPAKGPRAAAPIAGPGARRPEAATARKPDPAASADDDTPAALRALATKLKEQTLFEVLGVAEDATDSAVKVAYFKLAKRFHPDTVPPGAPPEVGGLKADVFARIGEAYRRLGTASGREEYLEEVRSGGKEVDVGQILHAEECFHKGTVCVKARKFPEAVNLLDEAIETNPDEGEFYAWRGYARYFATEDKKVAMGEARSDFDQALSLNPRCAPLHYFKGHLAKLTGDLTAARKEFQKAVEIDANHIEAQRELRMMSKK